MRTQDELAAAIARLKSERTVLLAYASTKFDATDHHGVQDAMSDVREVEAAMKALEYALGLRDAVREA